MAKAKKNVDEMTFMDHLEELRWMLVRSCIAILIMAAAAFIVSDYIFDVLIFGPTNPDFVTYDFFCQVTKYFGLGDAGCVTEMPFIIQNTNMEGQISILIWICIAAGFILAFPYILWELWKFIRPALYEKERRNAMLFIVSASFLFFLGVLFGYFIIVPLSVNFFASFSVSSIIKNEFNLDSYIGMIKSAVIACGLFFELPAVIFFLAKLGIVSPAFLRKYRKYAVVILLIIAAIVTPPDVVSQIIVALPMMLVYELSILMASLVAKKETAKQIENE